MKIELTGKPGDFVLENTGSVFSVTAVDEEDAQLAESATAHIAGAIRFSYTPCFGSLVHFAAGVAAKYLHCKIKTELPPAKGELEEAFGWVSSRAFCPTGQGGGIDNSCSSAERAFPASFPKGSRESRKAIDEVVRSQGRNPKKIWDRSKGIAMTPDNDAIDSIANEQQSQSGKPLAPEARVAYDALIDEIGKQYQAILDSGIRVAAWKGEGEPYGDPPGSAKPNSNKMREAVADTGEYSFFMTEKGFGTGAATEGHPMLRETQFRTSDGEPMIANDLFRVVHDFVAHVRGGYSFSTNGEYNGMLTHASTLPREAWPALFAETFGQNAVYERTGNYAAQNAYASSVGPQIIERELTSRFGPIDGDGDGIVNEDEKNDRSIDPELVDDSDKDSDEPLGFQHLKTRPWLVQQEPDSERAWCPGASPPDNSCSPANKGEGNGDDSERARVLGIIALVAKKGGLSVKVNSGAEPARGFMVSRKGFSKTVPAKDFFDKDRGPEEIRKYCESNKETLSASDSYLGLWHDTRTGTVYFDVSDNIPDRKTAERLGRERNQIAIWDIDNAQEVNTGGTGEDK